MSHKARLILEYSELKTRIAKLDRILMLERLGELDFTLSVPRRVLEEQIYYMNEYLKILEKRCNVEIYGYDWDEL